MRIPTHDANVRTPFVVKKYLINGDEALYRYHCLRGVLKKNSDLDLNVFESASLV